MRAVWSSSTYGAYLETHADFYTYAGIHDSVLLYTTPITFISDLDVSTERVDNNGVGMMTMR